MQYDEFRAMNTDIVLAAEGDTDQVARGFHKAAEYIRMMEARLTRFAETSELAQLNWSGGTWFHASDELFAIAREVRALFDQTDGLFDPTILDALENIGYDKSMDEIRAQGVTAPHAPKEVARHDFRVAQFDDTTRAIFLPRGMRLDLGGIAKGWIAEHAVQLLAESADAGAVDAGGDMFMIGQPKDDGAWRVALEDPRDSNQTLAILRVGPGAIATSSVTRRRWQQGERVQHHLIDPRCSASAESDWLSVTVIAPHATIAEAFAKSLLIAGSRGASEIAARRDDIAFIAVNQEGVLWGSEKAKRFLDDGIE
jgi:FAD:protein FMN transferase